MSFIKDFKEKNTRAHLYLQTQKGYRYGKALEKAASLQPLSGGAALAGTAAALLAEELVSQDQKSLLSMFSGKYLTRQELESFLSRWDIEAVRPAEALLAACIRKEHPCLDFGPCAGPRLSGLLKYHRFRSLDLMSHYSRIAGALNSRMLRPFLIDESPLTAHFPELWDMHPDMTLVLPTEEDYLLGVKLLSGMGYPCSKTAHTHIISVKGTAAASLIYLCPLSALKSHTGPDFADALLAGAQAGTRFQAEVLLPGNEERVCLLLQRLGCALRGACSSSDLLIFTAEAIDLLRPESSIDWSTVAEDIRISAQSGEILLGAFFVNTLVPGLIPDKGLPLRECSPVLNRQAEADRRYFRRAFAGPLSGQFTVIKSRLSAKKEP